MSNTWQAQTEPATPPAGFIRLWVDGPQTIKYKDDAGNVFTLSTGVTAEEVEDIVANFITDSASVTWVYDDGANTLTATVDESGVDHDSLQNYVANEHIDHSSVNIQPGTGMTGGGDLTANRTLSLADTAVSPGTYGNGAVPQFTVDQQGRITAASDGPTLVLGDEPGYFEDLTSASTGGSALVPATDLWAYGVRPVGTYRYKLNLKIEPNSTSNDYIFELRDNGVALQGVIQEEGKDTSAAQRNSREIFGWVYFGTETSHDLQVFFAAENASGTLVLHEARLELWRVSPLDLT